MLTTLRNTAPQIAEYRHPLGRFSFRTVYADPSNKGRFSQKELGMVYSRDILGEPGSLNSTAPRLLEEHSNNNELNDREKEERTLEELRFVPGDFLLVAVLLPKNVTLPSELAIKGSGAGNTTTSGAGATSSSAAWRTSAGQSGALGKGDSGWGRSLSSIGPGTGRGGGHWRGESNAPSTRGGRGGGGGRGSGGDFGRDRRDRDRDRDIDRNDRVPPPRRNEPPSPRGGNEGRGDRGGRGGRNDRRSRSWSRSLSPPTRRRRYD